MPRRILMIRLSAIGDVINTLPSVSLLRRNAPADHLAFAVEDKAQDVVRGHPELDQVFVFPRRRWRRMLKEGDVFPILGELFRYVRRLRRQRFDITLDFQGNLKGAMHALLSGAPRRIGFAKGHGYEGNHLFQTERVTPDQPHRVDKFASLLKPLGIAPQGLDYTLPPTAPANLYGGKPYVIVHPGTSDFGAEKRWPPERYGELAKRIIRDLKLGVVVTWGPGERELALAVVARSEGRALLSPETRSLLQLAAIIRGSRVFVSADTGPMHLAAACRIPCIALFGPKDPAKYRPYGSIHSVIHRPDGMSTISVEDVYRLVAQKVGAPVKV